MGVEKERKTKKKIKRRGSL